MKQLTDQKRDENFCKRQQYNKQLKQQLKQQFNKRGGNISNENNNDEDSYYYEKYQKYKLKYLELKK